MIDLTRRLLRSPQGFAGCLIVLLLVLACIFGPLLAPTDPERISFAGRFHAPGTGFWFGGDQFGRDILSRMLIGARSTLPAAVLATLLGTSVGAVVGVASAYVGGRIDEAIMRTLDAVMAIPGLLLALLVVSTLGKGTVDATLAIAISFAPGMARITRSVALAVRQQDYVSAATARGESGAWIVLREMLPNVIAPVIVETTLRVAFAVMLFATLSFLGLGAQPPAPEWGLMVAEARAYMDRAPWMIAAPGCAIALTAIGFNLLGDGLRDALNPRLGRR
jgi:peptide/nickel transport system permease protein